MSFGIYLIRNLVNNKVYIGQTKVNFETRSYQHFNSLRKNKHESSVLQYAYNKYGDSNFRFEEVESLSDETLLNEKEIYYINEYKSLINENGYNILSGGNNPPSTQKNVYVYSLINRCLLNAFSSVKDCADHFKVERSGLSRHIRNKIVIPVLKDYFITYDYIDEKELNYDEIKSKINKKSKVNSVYVYNYETLTYEKQFMTLNECANYYNVDPATIRNFIRLSIKQYNAHQILGKFIFSFEMLNTMQLSTIKKTINSFDKSLFVYNKQGKLLNSFFEVTDASKFYNVAVTTIIKRINGIELKRKTFLNDLIFFKKFTKHK